VLIWNSALKTWISICCIERGNSSSWGNASGGAQDAAAEDTASGWARKDTQQFDIGTWENPGGNTGTASSTGSTSGASKTMTDAGWSTDVDNTKNWSSGSNWSAGGGGVETKESATAWSTGEIGHWNAGAAGDDINKSAGKDWRNDSAGSVELSPGSQWKKEVGSVGNWADAVPSPRSDQEDNPLNASIETVARKIVW
jgi:hypothetical protein